MQVWPVVLLAVLMTGCSSKDEIATAADVDAAAQQADGASATPHSQTAADAADGAPDAPDAAAGDRARQAEAALTVQRYIGEVLNANRGDSDQYWVGGSAPPQPDDALLRSITDVRNLRVDHDAPIALDKETPPRSLQIPVRIRITTGAELFRYAGYYRVRLNVDGDAWEITSASLQPVLD